MDAFASFPSWSPDGTRLSFYIYQEGQRWTCGRSTPTASKLVEMTQTLASENKSQCTFACHAAAWSPDGARLAYADGDQTRVFTMRSDDGTDQVKVSHDDPTGRSHFPLYLADGRLAYVTEHINPGQSWTDIWAITPGSGQPPAALLQDVQVQGPFEFSPDGQTVLFSSPRNGNFDIYVATLDASGKEALKTALERNGARASAGGGRPPGPASTAGQPIRRRRRDLSRHRRSGRAAATAAPQPGCGTPVAAAPTPASDRVSCQRVQPVRAGAGRAGR